jgi:hypothetical protein
MMPIVPSVALSVRVQPDGGALQEEIHGLMPFFLEFCPDGYMVFSRTQYHHDACLAVKANIYILNHFEWALSRLNAVLR